MYDNIGGLVHRRSQQKDPIKLDGDSKSVGLQAGRVTQSADKQQTLKFTNMKKLQILKAAKIAHLVIWTIIALLIIVSTCKVWWANGCGVLSLIAAIAFYGACCTGLCVAGHIMFNEEIAEIDAATQRPVAPAEQPKKKPEVH